MIVILPHSADISGTPCENSRKLIVYAEIATMLSIQDKTKTVVQILIDTLELRSAVRRPLTNKEIDKKTGEIKTVKYTGDIEELSRWFIDLKKFENEGIYPDEVNGILAKVSSKCKFTYYVTCPTPIFHGQAQVVLEKPAKTTWAKIIKNLKNYVDIRHREPSKVLIYLEKNGDLWREPKSKYCYKMGEDGDRHKIVRFLAMKKGLQKTSTIHTKNTKLIRNDIGKIRNNIEKFLKLKGKEVIESKGYSGYGISILYKILLEN